MARNLPLRTVLLLCAAALVTACNPAARTAAPAAPQAEVQTTPVQVAGAITGDISEVLNYTGNLQAQDTVKITPLVSGRVDSVPVKVGDEVKTGDALATIESDLYAAQAKQAEVALQMAQIKLDKMHQGPRPEELTAAEEGVRTAEAALKSASTVTDDQRTVAAANMARAEAALKLAQHEYDKISFAGQAGMMPQALQLEQATVAYQSAVAAYNMQTNPSDLQLAPLQGQLAAARLKLALTKQPFVDSDFALAQAGIDQSKAALDMAHIQFDNATVHAPFDGVVAEVYITKGSLVGPQAPMFTLVSKNEEVVVEVEESRIARLQPGAHASLRVSAYPGRDFPATVSTLAPTADTKTHTFSVKVAPVDDANLLRAGMYAEVALLAQEKQGALLVPRDAIVKSGDQATVYLVTDGVAYLRPVTIGLSDGERIEVMSGLSPGDQVVTVGQINLTDGARVDVVKG